MTIKSTLSSPSSQIAKLDWQRIASDLHSRGFALVPGILNTAECDELISGYDDEQAYRKTVSMQRYRFGLGHYKYWQYPLPDIVQNLREALYPYLAPIVNEWYRKLGITPGFPEHLSQMLSYCHENGQLLPTPLILKYGEKGFNTLHQDLYGDVYFPVQAAINLSKPGVDYEGAEFVMTEQVPRAQSKAIVLSPDRGDMIIFTTNFRPVKGSRGYYRSKMRHGISELHRGQRHAIGIIFHDAKS